MCVNARGQTGKLLFVSKIKSRSRTIKKSHSTNSGYNVTNARQTRDKFPKSGHGQTEQFKNLVDARNVRYLLGCRTTGVTECDTAITLIWFTRDKKCFSRSRTRKMKIFFPRRAIWSDIFYSNSHLQQNKWQFAFKFPVVACGVQSTITWNRFRIQKSLTGTD